MKKQTLKRTVFVWITIVTSCSAFAQDSPPIPPGANNPIPPVITKVVRPKQDTGILAVHCPFCDKLRVFKALKMQTNGCAVVDGGVRVEVAATVKCPKTKKQFTTHFDRVYQSHPKAVEVDGEPDK